VRGVLCLAQLPLRRSIPSFRSRGEPPVAFDQREQGKREASLEKQDRLPGISARIELQIETEFSLR
jgi:hypothetical protein